jgi:hypothetical protein
VADETLEVERDFDASVNMTATEIERWLGTDESKAVGDSDGGESTGHRSGRRIVEILEKKKSERTDADREHMRKVSGFVKRHLAQRPEKEEIEGSRWRYSLMNWGHDPLK